MNKQVYKRARIEKKSGQRSKGRQKGLSLVELMIAMVIGLILLTGILQITIANSDNSRMHEQMSRVQEAGRFAIDILSKDIRMADFWGCASSLSKITNNLNPAGSGYAGLTFDNGVVGEDGASGGPDSITLSGAYGTGLTIQPPYGPQANSNVKVLADNPLEQFDIVLLSDCLAGDIFEITNANPGGSGTVDHNTGTVAIGPGNYNPSPTCVSGHCLSKVYEGDASIYRMQSLTYSIQQAAFQEPKLVRSLNGGTPVELVSGVEDMQFDYGVDTNGDSVADYYKTATQVTAAGEWEAVVTVKVSLLIRAGEAYMSEEQTYIYNGDTVTSDDNRLRRVFTTVITIRNRTS